MIKHTLVGEYNKNLYIASTRWNDTPTIELDSEMPLKGVAKLKSPISMTVSLEKTDRSLLPGPYSSKCRDYANEGLISKIGCLKRCKIDKAALSYPLGVPIWTNTALNVKNFTIVTECSDKCQQ